MRKRDPLRRVAGVATVLAVALALGLSTFAAGCGAQTPEQAVRDFYKAIEEHDWNAYLGSVLPDNVRRMTEVDVQKQKEEFKASDYSYKGLKLKTEYDKKDKDKADVKLVAGLVSGKNPSTGEKERTTIAKIKKEYGFTPSIETRKSKGRWYVVVPLASVDSRSAIQ